MESQLKEFPLPWSFFDALKDSGAAAITYDEPSAEVRGGRIMSSGEIGCFKSHYTVLVEFCSNEDADWLMVLEDDLLVDCDFNYGGLIDFMESNRIGFMKLFSKRWTPVNRLGYFEHREILRYRIEPLGAQAYILNKQSAAAIIGNISAITRPFDDELERFWEHKVDILGIFPFPIIEKGAETTINSPTSVLSSKPRTALQIQFHRLRRLAIRAKTKISKIQHNALWLARYRSSLEKGQKYKYYKPPEQHNEVRFGGKTGHIFAKSKI